MKFCINLLTTVLSHINIPGFENSKFLFANSCKYLCCYRCFLSFPSPLAQNQNSVLVAQIILHLLLKPTGYIVAGKLGKPVLQDYSWCCNVATSVSQACNNIFRLLSDGVSHKGFFTGTGKAQRDSDSNYSRTIRSREFSFGQGRPNS